jgi:hypothetical protein
VCAFEDCIGLGVGCGHNYSLDSIGLKELLKLDSSEFGSFVMKTEKGTSHSAAFFIQNNNQLEQVCAWNNHS